MLEPLQIAPKLQVLYAEPLRSHARADMSVREISSRRVKRRSDRDGQGARCPSTCPGQALRHSSGQALRHNSGQAPSTLLKARFSSNQPSSGGSRKARAPCSVQGAELWIRNPESSNRRKRTLLAIRSRQLPHRAERERGVAGAKLKTLSPSPRSSPPTCRRGQCFEALCTCHCAQGSSRW
jgi:hypothetical protein